MKPLNWLGEFTAARVALGRQLSTRDWLALREAHAEARDAIQSAITWPAGIPVVASQCRDRNEYLLRPDAGRRLDPGADLPGIARGADVLLAVVDGLSPLAVTRYAAAVVEGLRRELAGLDVAGSVGVARGRVAIGDELGERLGARLVAVLIGERPGLSAADSLGIYLTYEPRIGRTDAERNCLSNIREGGLAPLAAVERCAWLIWSALELRLTGWALKEDATSFAPPTTERSIPNP